MFVLLLIIIPSNDGDICQFKSDRIHDNIIFQVPF